MVEGHPHTCQDGCILAKHIIGSPAMVTWVHSEYHLEVLCERGSHEHPPKSDSFQVRYVWPACNHRIQFLQFDVLLVVDVYDGIHHCSLWVFLTRMLK